MECDSMHSADVTPRTVLPTVDNYRICPIISVLYYYYQFEEQRHEPVLFPEIYVKALVLYGLQQLCFTVCSVRAAYSTSRGHEFPRDVLAVYS
jgi:hypothetical protein